eukprot:637682-Prymnesium_polylepis.1
MAPAIAAISTAPETSTPAPGGVPEMLFGRLLEAPDSRVVRALYTLFRTGSWCDSVPLDVGEAPLYGGRRFFPP